MYDSIKVWGFNSFNLACKKKIIKDRRYNMASALKLSTEYLTADERYQLLHFFYSSNLNPSFL